jgi:hypothetical protein
MLLLFGPSFARLPVLHFVPSLSIIIIIIIIVRLLLVVCFLVCLVHCALNPTVVTPPTVHTLYY